jgi:ligand-binding sensor domain-containing protein
VIHWDVETSTATPYGQNDGLPTTAAMSVEAAPDGTVWAGGGSSFGVWLAHFDGSWTAYSKPADLASVEIIDFGSMSVGADGRVWAAVSSSAGSKLLRFDGTWTAIAVPDEIGAYSSPWGFALAVAPDGTLWAATPNGVASFDGTTWTTYSKANTGLPRTPWLAGIAQDGSVWVELSGEGCTVWTGCAVPAAGVARFDGTTWTVYTSAYGLADDDANLLVGSPGDIWITYASKPDTVSRFDGQRWD